MPNIIAMPIRLYINISCSFNSLNFVAIDLITAIRIILADVAFLMYVAELAPSNIQKKLSTRNRDLQDQSFICAVSEAADNERAETGQSSIGNIHAKGVNNK